jgi:hypothetical protein
MLDCMPNIRLQNSASNGAKHQLQSHVLVCNFSAARNGFRSNATSSNSASKSRDIAKKSGRTATTMLRLSEHSFLAGVYTFAGKENTDA